jgi:hypothetical protein
MALTALTTGTNNAAFGRGAGLGITTGTVNACFGVNSGTGITTGNNNMSFGYQANLNTTSGSNNVAIGRDANEVNTTGNDNICIGTSADTSAADGATQVVVGYGLVGKGNNTGYFGGSSGVYNSANNSSWSTTSDRRIKKNITDNNTGLDKINQLQVRNFEYRTLDEVVDFDNAKAAYVDKQGTQVGVIAQEIQEVLPDVVEEMTTGVLTVNPDNLTWYLVNAVKELSAEIKALKEAA